MLYFSLQVSNYEINQMRPPQEGGSKNPRGSNFDNLSEKDIYELQLHNLQEQLEKAVIENSTLGEMMFHNLI